MDRYDFDFTALGYLTVVVVNDDDFANTTALHKVANQSQRSCAAP
jgi:hypothetical protein